MAHPEQRAFVDEVKSFFPGMFVGKDVLEIGSLNINGTVRSLFEDCNYIGLDVVAGPCVDKVCWAHKHSGLYDVVISCESLEHDPFWEKTLKRMSTNLKPGGLLIITAAGPNRPEHGTLRTNPTSSGTCQTKHGNHYRNLTQEDLIEKLGLSGDWSYGIGYNRDLWDVYLWAVKDAD